MEWIDVNDKLPKQLDIILVYGKVGDLPVYGMFTALVAGDSFLCLGNKIHSVTHWCEITPPEKEHKTIIFE